VNHDRETESRLPGLTWDLKNNRTVSRTTIRKNLAHHVGDDPLPREKRLAEELRDRGNFSAAACAA
jgi:hypothetical protein